MRRPLQRRTGPRLLAGILAALLLVVATASAKPQKLDVKVKGDSDAQLTMKLSKKGGVPTKLTGVKITGLLVGEGLATCEPVTASHSFGAIPVQSSFVFPGNYTFSASEVGEYGLTFSITGQSKTAGKSWQGTMSASIAIAGSEGCSSGQIPYSAKKKKKRK